MTDYFYQTGKECESLANLIAYKKVAGWVFDSKSNIYAAPVPLPSLDPYLQDVATKFAGVPLIFRFPEHSFYLWHVDRLRKCALNCELTYGNSKTYFGKKGVEGSYTDLQILNYNNQMVLLNTAEYHCIANVGAERIIFTLGFNHTPYHEVKAYLKDK